MNGWAIGSTGGEGGFDTGKHRWFVCSMMVQKRRVLEGEIRAEAKGAFESFSSAIACNG